MNDFFPLIPLVAGALLFFGGFKFLLSKGMPRAYGLTLILSSLSWTWWSAITLVTQGKSWPAIEFLVVLFFFVGLSLLMPKPELKEGEQRKAKLAAFLYVAGFVLGILHCLALIFTTGWPERLAELYLSLHLPGVARP